MKLLKTIVLLAATISFFSFADVAVIVNTTNNSAISDSDIKRIFLGKNKSFASGESVKAINLKSGDSVRAEFEKKVLGKSSQQIKAYWSKLIFSGKAKPLAEKASAQEVIAYVNSNSAAIAYIDASKVDDSVKVVKVF